MQFSLGLEQACEYSVTKMQFSLGLERAFVSILSLVCHRVSAWVVPISMLGKCWNETINYCHKAHLIIQMIRLQQCYYKLSFDASANGNPGLIETDGVIQHSNAKVVRWGFC